MKKWLKTASLTDRFGLIFRPIFPWETMSDCRDRSRTVVVPQKHPELGSNRIPNVWDAPYPRMVDKSVKIRHYPSPQEDSQLSILITKLHIKVFSAHTMPKFWKNKVWRDGCRQNTAADPHGFRSISRSSVDRCSSYSTVLKY